MDDTNAGQNALKVIIISDGTGETATALARATITQFKDKDVYFTRYKNVRSKEQITSIFTEAAIHHDMIIYTVVDSEIRECIAKTSREKNVRTVDLMGPMLTAFSNIFHSEPISKPGLYHAVNDEYFKRVEAIEFTLNHDDGRNLASLSLADVILVGISRTSKTPLSIYLSLHGIKVVNVPLIHGVEAPSELQKVDQRKIFGLTIDPDTLHEIRKNRLTRLGTTGHKGDYAEISRVIQEVEWANDIFKQNKRWPVFNVTGKALEETAAEIMKLINMRKQNIYKQSKRYTKEKETE